MVDDQDDHPNLIKIKRLIETKILCHEPFVHNAWLKKQAQKVQDELDRMADKADGLLS